MGSESAAQTIYMRNTGTTPTGMLTSTLVGNNPGDFSIVPGSNTCMAPLPGASICQLSLKFKPTTSGMRSAVLNITSVSGGSGSLLLTGTGLGIGTVLAWAGTRAMQNQLYGVTATDPQTFASVIGLLATIAVLASYLPARRASRVDPIAVLRTD